MLIIEVQAIREACSQGQTDKVAESRGDGRVTVCLVGEILLCLNCLLAEMIECSLCPETCEVSHTEIVDWGVLSVYCF